MKNKKGQDMNLIILAVGIGALLVVGLVIFGFVVTFMTGATAKQSGAGCSWSLSMLEVYNAQVEALEKEAKKTAEKSLSGVWYPTKGLSIVANGITKGEWKDDATLGLQNMVGDVANFAKVNVDMCIENIPELCAEPADEVAKCLYRRAAETFYTLHGERDFAKKNAEDGSTFILYNIETKATKPGTLSLEGSCYDYIKNDYMNGAKESSSVSWLYDNVNNVCNVTIKVIDEKIMTLAMIEQCQQASDLSNDYDCKCFAKGESVGFGYILDNGIPNTEFDTDELSTDNDPIKDVAGTAKYEKNPSDYIGCGKKPSPDASEIGGVDFSLDTDRIHFSVVDFPVADGEQITLYTHLCNDGKEVMITDNEEGQSC